MMLWKRLIVAAVVCLTGVQVQAQVARMAKDAHPSFEVATIKPPVPDDRSQGFHTSGQRIFIENESITSLVMFAYAVHPKQIVDGPEWMTERFDIHGVPDVAGAPSLTQLQGMVQKLLAERFGLKVHREKRELAVYTITVAKGGSRLEPNESDPNGASDQTGNGSSKGQTMRFTNNSMADFALGMQYFLDRPVVDRTGLAGKYDFTLQWKSGVATVEDDSDYPGLFTAVEEQLGLKLNAVRDQVDVLVVDKLERPTAN